MDSVSGNAMSGSSPRPTRKATLSVGISSTVDILCRKHRIGQASAYRWDHVAGLPPGCAGEYSPVPYQIAWPWGGAPRAAS